MTIKEISLLTGNLQPKGHPFYVDAETLAGAERLLADRPLAAHLSHAGAASDRLGTAIGFFKGIYRDGLQLRAKTFEFLDSFKANFKAQYDNLAELATKFPEQFGVSLHLKYQPVWVMGDGSEVAAKVVDGKLSESAPKGAVRPLPSARVTAIPAGDFVTSPAANLSGLLSGLLAEIDTNPVITMSKDKTPTTFDQAAVDAKLDEQKTALTAELSAAHKTALDTIAAQLAEANVAKSDLDAKLVEATAAKTVAETALAARDKDLIAVLSSAGVKVEKFDAPAIKAALDSRISTEAQAFLATRGIKPVAEVIAKSGEIDASLSTDEQIVTAYLALPHGSPESITFLDKHRDAIWRAHTGKK